MYDFCYNEHSSNQKHPIIKCKHPNLPDWIIEDFCGKGDFNFLKQDLVFIKDETLREEIAYYVVINEMIIRQK